MIINKNNLVNNLIKVFNAFFLIISIIIMLVSILGIIASQLFEKYSSHFFFGGFKKLESIHLIIVIFFVMFCLYIFYNKLLVLLDNKKFIILFTIINILRFAFFLIFASAIKPFSDFQNAYDIAVKNYDFTSLLVRYSHFPQWCNFICLERLICSAGINYYSFFVLIELLLNSIISLIIYIVSILIIDNKQVGYVASIFYLLNPSNILYSMVFKPDTISLLFVMIAVCFYSYILKNINNIKIGKFIKYDVLASIFIAIGNAYKPITLIYIIAFNSVCLFYLFKINRVKLLIGLLIVMVSFLPINFYIGSSISGFTENILNTTLDRDATWHYLCIGLNTESEGQIHIGTKSRYYAVTRSQYDYDTTVQMTKNMLVKDYKSSSPKKLILNFGKKFVWVVQDDIIPAYYFNNNIINTKKINLFQKIVYKVMTIFSIPLSWICYIIILSFGVYSIIDIIEENYKVLFIKVCCFGYLCVLMLSEGQSRYKSNIIPFLIILASIGMNKFLVNYKIRKML